MNIKKSIAIVGMCGILGGCASYDMRTDSGLAATIVDPTGILGGVSRELLGTGPKQPVAVQRAPAPTGRLLKVYDNTTWENAKSWACERGRFAVYDNAFRFSNTRGDNWVVLPFHAMYDIELQKHFFNSKVFAAKTADRDYTFTFGGNARTQAAYDELKPLWQSSR
ncbi:MAG: hypothetical protein AABX11_00630 [Nanoarchaeota archaeon]